MTVGQLAADSATVGVSGMVLQVEGDVDPDVVAALVAAVDAVWPRPSTVTVDDRSRIPAWRFSGRWWSRPATVRRVRPWT